MSKLEIHQSTLSLLSKCGMMAYFYAVEKLRSPPGVAAVMGTATHRAAKADLRSKRDRGRLLKTEAVRDIASDAFDDTWDAQDPLLSDDEKREGVTRVRGKAKDSAIALATRYHAIIAPKTKPKLVEHFMRVELEGYPCDIAGTLDVVEQDDDVRDTKTSGKSLAQKELSRSVQFDTYELMLSIQNGGRRPRLRKMDVLTTAASPKTYTMVARASTSNDAILRRIEYACRVFETGAFYPVDPTGPSGWVCSARWCGFYDNICPFGRKAKVQI